MQTEGGEAQPPVKWDVLSDQLHADCRVFHVRKNRCRHPVDHREGDFFVIQSRDWANVVALTEQREVIFIRQYRFGSRELSWEVPGGIIDAKEGPEKAAARELLEETGYAGDPAEKMGSCYPNPALFNNECHFMLIQNAKFKQAQSLDLHEEIEVKLVPLEETFEWIRSQEIPPHAMTINALFFLREKLGI